MMLRGVRWLLLLLPCLALANKPPFDPFHEATYQLGWDIHFSPYAGGEDILFAHRSIERLEGYFIKNSPLWYSQKASARIWRLTELYLGWLPLNYLAVVAQHEVFGHGYRMRDINRGRVQVKGYSFDTPPPYGPGGAATSYEIGPHFTTTEQSAVAIAGVESTAILAQLCKLKWLESHRIDPRQTVLYLLGQHDLNLYIGSLKALDDSELHGHDIHGYIQSLNMTYTNHFISAARLRSLSWMNLADPFTFYSIYAWFNYFLTGKETQIPMIPLYGLKYLPTFRLGLTPFGPEIFFENYLLQGTRPIYFYLVGGSHSDNRYGGVGFYAPRIWALQKWNLGFRFDGWWQPKLLFQQGNTPFLDIDFDVPPNKTAPLYPYSEQHAKNLGAAASVLVAYQSAGRSGFSFELGGKSQGFLPGYALRASPTARLFYSLIF